MNKQRTMTCCDATRHTVNLPLLLSRSPPCSQEGADSCMILQAAQHNRHKILIRTVDTDVVVLAVSMAQDLGPEDELRLAFGAGKILAHKIAIHLGPKKAHSLPLLHVLTGVTLCPVLLGMVRSQQPGQPGRLSQNSIMHCQNYLVHQISYRKIFYIQLRGLPSDYMTGPAHAQILRGLPTHCMTGPAHAQILRGLPSDYMTGPAHAQILRGLSSHCMTGPAHAQILRGLPSHCMTRPAHAQILRGLPSDYMTGPAHAQILRGLPSDYMTGPAHAQMLRGLPSHCMTGPTHAQILTRPNKNSSQGGPM